jgi:hypothetical protein
MQACSAIGALHRAEQDLEERLARRVSALEELGQMHASEPVYQALFFALANVRKRRKRMERNCQDAPTPSMTEVRNWIAFGGCGYSEDDVVRGVDDRIEEALDAALAMTFPASDPVAVFVAVRAQTSPTVLGKAGGPHVARARTARLREQDH